MRIVLARLLSRVRLRLLPGASLKPVRRGVTLSPAGGTPVVVDQIWPARR